MGTAIENEAQRKQVTLIFQTKVEEKVSMTNNLNCFQWESWRFVLRFANVHKPIPILQAQKQNLNIEMVFLQKCQNNHWISDLKYFTYTCYVDTFGWALQYNLIQIICLNQNPKCEGIYLSGSVFNIK